MRMKPACTPLALNVLVAASTEPNRVSSRSMGIPTLYPRSSARELSIPGTVLALADKSYPCHSDPRRPVTVRETAQRFDQRGLRRELQQLLVQPFQEFLVVKLSVSIGPVCGPDGEAIPWPFRPCRISCGFRADLPDRRHGRRRPAGDGARPRPERFGACVTVVISTT